MSLRRHIGAVVLGLFLGNAVCIDVACAEQLIVSISNHRVTVTSSYSGEELVLFGSVERDTESPVLRSPYDIVVTVIGPRADMVTRRKERKFGIWVSAESRQFLNVPIYLAVSSNRPIDAIAAADVRRRRQLGIDNILLTQRVGVDYADVVPSDPFRRAFVRLRREQGLYRESANGIAFLTPTLFRAGITLPAAVPTGSYAVDIKLLAAGAVVGYTQTTFEIAKVGFQEVITNAARQQGLAYGLATALMALLTGWMASLMFRRD